MYHLPNTIKYIDPSKEIGLIAKAQSGDLSSRNILVEAYLPLIIKLVEKFAGSGHPIMDDLIQEGAIGAFTAIQKFDTTRSNKYITYAYWWIRVFIQNGLQLERNWCTLTQDVDSVHFTRNKNNVHNIGSDDRVDSDDFYTYIVDECPTIFETVHLSPFDLIDDLVRDGLNCHHDFLTTVLQLVNGEVTSTQRKILKLYYHYDWTLAQIGKRLQISPRWIFSLRNQAIESIKAKVDDFLTE